MKSLRLAAAVALLTLATSGAFAATPRLVPHQGGPVSKDPSSASGAAACFDVYCDGVDSGWTVCGNDLGAIIDTAVGICS